MRFDTLRKLFLEKHPDGNISAEGKRAVHVRFRSTGTWYKYKYRGYVWLADELDLLPTLDYDAIAHDIVSRLADGEAFVIAPAGADDRAQALWRKRGLSPDVIIGGVHCDQDEYGRAIAKYTLLENNDDWSCTKRD